MVGYIILYIDLYIVHGSVLLFPGCAYYASRALAETAQIIFCPYNYVVDPMIRSAMQIDIKGSIVIMDEAQ